MLTPLGHTRDVPLVSFRVSAQVRERLEREASVVGVGVNELVRRWMDAALEAAERRVDTGDLASRPPAPRGLTVVYDEGGLTNGDD